MKKIRLSSALMASFLLSGCGGMMYGPNTAPVINQNQYANTTFPAVNPNYSTITPTPLQPAPINPYLVDTPKYQAQTQAMPPQASDTPKYEQSAYSAMPPRANDQPKYATPPSASDQPKYDNSGYGQDAWAVSPNQSNNVTREENTPRAPVPPPVKVNKNPENPDVNETAETTAENHKPTAEPVAEEKQVAANTPATPERPQAGGAAVSELLSKASAALGKGDLNTAAAHLEAAQRIDSKNPKILYDIANIRYHQQRYREAETFAGRAANLGGENSMSKKSWQLISNARKALGDNQGAVQAAERAARFN